MVFSTLAMLSRRSLAFLRSFTLPFLCSPLLTALLLAPCRVSIASIINTHFEYPLLTVQCAHVALKCTATETILITENISPNDSARVFSDICSTQFLDIINIGNTTAPYSYMRTVRPRHGLPNLSIRYSRARFCSCPPTPSSSSAV